MRHLGSALFNTGFFNAMLSNKVDSWFSEAESKLSSIDSKIKCSQKQETNLRVLVDPV